MKKIYLFWFVFWLSIFAASAQAEIIGYAAGSGTESDPYIISSLDELNYFAAQVNVGNDYSGQYFQLKYTINAGGESTPFTPIGGNGSSSVSFDGVFDGNGRYITDLYICSDEGMYVGFFGVLGTHAEVKNLGITGKSKIVALGYAGAIAGKNQGKIENCYSYASVSANTNVGGIAGSSEGEIARCYNVGTVSAVKTNTSGGIAGYNTGQIDDCFNAGSISAVKNNAGGIAGSTSSTGVISSCFNSGLVVAAQRLGGIAGYAMGASRIEGCYSSGQYRATATGNAKGALIGEKDALTQVTNCYYDGQMCAEGGVMSQDIEGTLKLQTKEMVSGTPYEGFSPDKWTFAEGFYPLLASIASNDVAKVAATPVILDDNDTYLSVRKGFRLNTSKVGVWASSSTALRIGVDTVAVFPFPEADTECILSGKPYASSAFSRSYYLYVAKGTPAVLFGGGDGSENDPYLIKNQDQLARLADDVNQGFSYKDLHFRLENDLSLQGNWIPIGTKVSYTELAFDGTFDGNNRRISGLNVNKDTDGAGLFGFTGENSYIGNLTIESGTVELTGTYKYSAGGLTGSNLGKIENCVNHANVIGYNYTAGIAGRNKGDITNCRNDGLISGNENTGGIAGTNSGIISSCYNRGNVVGAEYTGGIAGICDGEESCVSDCYNTGIVLLTGCPRDYSKAGGICGYLTGKVDRCFNTGVVMANSENDKVWHYAGGLVGKLYNAVLSDSYNTAPVYGISSSAGGIAGMSSGDRTKVENCYNLGIGQSDLTNGASETIVELKDTGTYIRMVYDKQMNAIGNGLHGTALFTKQMTGTAGIEGFGSDKWVFAEGLYPRIRGLEEVPEALLNASAVILHVDSDNKTWDSRTLITNNFTVHAADGVAWQIEENPSVRLEGNTGIVDLPQENDVVAKLTASLAGLEKEFVLNVMVKIEGTGMPDDPWLIESPELLRYLSNKVNAGEQYIDRFFRQTADIDLGGEANPFIPIGGNAYSAYKFRGNYDGNHRLISNMVINQPENNYVGLFGYVGENGVVKNLALADNCKVTGAGYVGGLVGECNGEVTGCSSAATVSGSTSVGGIVGWSNATAHVHRCYNSGPVSSTRTNTAGGIVGGHTSFMLSECFNIGTVTARTGQAGGICGYNSGAIENCFNAGTVTAPSAVGGIAGRITNAGSTDYTSRLINCYSSGICIATESTHLGGIAGKTDNNQLTITNCYFDKQMSATGGIDGVDTEGQAVGLLTREMIGNPLAGLETGSWNYTEGLYPALVPFSGVAAQSVAVSPVSLYTAGEAFETSQRIENDFSVSTANGVAWSATSANLEIAGDQVCVISGGDTRPDFILTASLDGVCKELTMRLKNETSVLENRHRPVKVYSRKGAVSIETTVPCTVEIMDMKGRMISRRVTGSRVTIPVGCGVYLVKTTCGDTSSVVPVLVR